MLLERLGKELLYFDGGMGTLLQSKGLQPGELPEVWNLEHAEEIIDIHKAYFEAGSDIVLSNTFGANAIKFHDSKYGLKEIVTAGIQNAKKAAERGVHDGRKTYVALDVGPTGKLLKPMGDLSFEDAYDAFKETMIYGEQAGADLIHIETMSDSYEVKAAVLAAKENTSLPVFATMIFDEKGKLLTGGCSGGGYHVGRPSCRCIGNQLWYGTGADASDSGGYSEIRIGSDHRKTECRTSEAA